MNNLYIILLENKKNVSKNIGKKGIFLFSPGYYIYIGSAKKNPMARIERHLKKEKKLFWHIDYITSFMEIRKVLLFRFVEFTECELAQNIFNEFKVEFPGKGLGSSDCKCYSHFAKINEKV
ncbi:MAG: GIY-YIG nuclease family protein [Candidatus Muirbacterium halophilum]|nr:GIY-YIG nuclease family protein [Candidatus Muirbacterium halophilum]MCK9474515.1 GIY-YIG nuclease family protein [Candidatus Muirbacterium halophilum]